MSRFTILLGCFAVVLALSGCGTSGTSEQGQPATIPGVAQQTDDHEGGGDEGHSHTGDYADHAHHDEDSPGHDHADHDHGSANSAEIEGALALLSTTDRALADEQKICPVSGDPLGAMGTPIKLTVQGNDVFICCKGCEEPLLQDPDKYLAQKTD